MAKKINIRDRIKEFKRVKASEFLDNQKNWRTHPEAQAGALKGILEQIGIAGALTAYHSPRNNGKLTLIDGHLRKGAADVEWPVLILDVDDAEADLLLATLDPLASIAGTNAEALDDLLRGVETGNAELMAFLDELAQKAGIVPEVEAPEDFKEFDEDLATDYKCPKCGYCWSGKQA